MIREHEIKEKIAQAISYEISIADLAHWIYSNSWNMHQNSSPSAVALASDVHLLLAERDDFSLDDAAFLSELITLKNAADIKVLNIEEPQSPQVVYVFRPLSPSLRLPLISVSL